MFSQGVRLPRLCPLQVFYEPLQLPVSPPPVLLRVQGGRGERELFPLRVAAGQCIGGDASCEDGVGHVLQAERQDDGTGTAEDQLEGGTFEGRPPGAEAVEVHRVAVAVFPAEDGAQPGSE